MPSLIAFAHANGFPGGSYRCFLDRLAPEYQVRPHPMLGHDPARPVGAHWSGLVGELEAWLETLPRPLIGMGHSMGGVLMFKVACRHPDWFRAVVMLDPPVVNGFSGVVFNLARLVGMGDRLTPAGKSRGRLDHWASREDVDSYFHSRPLFRRFDPQCLENYLDSGLLEDGQGGYRLRFDPAVEVEIFRTTPGDLWRYPRLPVPGLLISGEQSPPRFREAAARHHRRHRMAFRRAPGGHLFPLERPQEAADVLRAGLNELMGEPHATA